MNSDQTIEHDGYEFDRDVIAQLSAVRDTGATNMFSASGVADVAEQCEFDALLEFLGDARRRRADGAKYIAALEAMAEFDRGANQ